MNNEWTKGIDDLRAENKELLEALKLLVNAYGGIGSKGEEVTEAQKERELAKKYLALYKATGDGKYLDLANIHTFNELAAKGNEARCSTNYML